MKRAKVIGPPSRISSRIESASSAFSEPAAGSVTASRRHSTRIESAPVLPLIEPVTAVRAGWRRARLRWLTLRGGAAYVAPLLGRRSDDRLAAVAEDDCPADSVSVDLD